MTTTDPNTDFAAVSAAVCSGAPSYDDAGNLNDKSNVIGSYKADILHALAYPDATVAAVSQWILNQIKVWGAVVTATGTQSYELGWTMVFAKGGHFFPANIDAAFKTSGGGKPAPGFDPAQAFTEPNLASAKAGKAFYGMDGKNHFPEMESKAAFAANVAALVAAYPVAPPIPTPAPGPYAGQDRRVSGVPDRRGAQTAFGEPGGRG